jgi:hypothetical protein
MACYNHAAIPGTLIDRMKTRLIESILSGRRMNPIWLILNNDLDQFVSLSPVEICNPHLEQPLTARTRVQTTSLCAVLAH